MPWFRVDDNLGFHHKVIAAGNAAMGLWVRAGSVCASQLTDGFVADHMIASLGTVAQAKKLVEVGLWSREKGGYAFHEWAERQPSRADVEAERAAAKERMRVAREKKRKAAREANAQASGSRSEEVRENTARTSGEVREKFGDPYPTQPDPTQPDPPKEDYAADAAKPKRATQRPADFRPSRAHADLANELGVDLRAEWQQFCDHHDAKGSTFKDWPAALRTWIRNAAKFGRSRPSAAGTPRQQADADMFARQMARAEAREAAARGEIA